MNPRFVIKFVVPESPSPEQMEIVAEAFRSEHEDFLLIGGKAELDILDLETNRVWRIDSSGIRETQAVRLIGPER